MSGVAAGDTGTRRHRLALTTDPVVILLVEDNPGDARLTMEALKEGSFPSRLCIATDGVEALEFLRREGPHAEAPRPGLVLLDLNLPKKDGLQVLREMKTDPELRRIPVVILTTSQAERDVASSYENHANCYVTKPTDLDRYFDVVRTIEKFWVEVAELPVR